MTLEDWGWDPRWAELFVSDAAAGLIPARVIAIQRGLIAVATADGDRKVRVRGRMQHNAKGAADLPAVGDWLAAENSGGEGYLQIRRILPRRTKLSRRAAGDAPEEQIIAANLETALIMTAMNADFNVRRLERFLAVVRTSGAEAVILLNKADECADPSPYLKAAQEIAGSAVVLPLSAKTGDGLDPLARWIKTGRTVGCVGTSGVGKSTLINRLRGTAEIRTAATRAKDERGRHTTTHRELFVLPGGGVILDTPGMREMQFWDAEQGVKQAFEEIDVLAPSCRFKDCGHDSEPGCAVTDAVKAGKILAVRYTAWRKLQDEIKATAKKRDHGAEAAERRRVRQAKHDADKPGRRGH